MDDAAPFGALGLPRAPVLPRVARRQSALQADAARRRVGDPPAARGDGRLHDLLRASRGRGVGRLALSTVLVCGPVAVDLLRPGPFAVVRLARRVAEPDQEGLLSEARHPELL